MKTEVIYARYSNDSQTEQSIEGQLRVCQEFAQRNDILILNTYIDRAITETNDNRPDFQQMIKDSTNKDFQYVVVYKLDRFSRNKYETYSAELAQKVKRGMHETRLKGYFQGGLLAYGYKLDGRKIVIDEDKTEIVRYIFKQYVIFFCKAINIDSPPRISFNQRI